MTEMRCESKLHAVILEEDVIEVKCNSRFCGAMPGWTVLHRFSVSTGELINTDYFKNPPVERNTA